LLVVRDRLGWPAGVVLDVAQGFPARRFTFRVGVHGKGGLAEGAGLVEVAESGSEPGHRVQGMCLADGIV
jgi:hypothetical protein